jgi:hypothetical protein
LGITKQGLYYVFILFGGKYTNTSRQNNVRLVLFTAGCNFLTKAGIVKFWQAQFSGYMINGSAGFRHNPLLGGVQGWVNLPKRGSKCKANLA